MKQSCCWLLASLVACTSERDETGQTGSPGARDCELDSECAMQAEAQLAPLRVPALDARTFVGARCEQLSVQGSSSAAGPACLCATDATGFIAVGPAQGGCFARGRAGECLWSDTFAGCSIGDASCTATCAELERRFADDASRTHTASVLHASCAAGHCRSVTQVDDRCYVDDSMQRGQAYECSLGVEALLAAAATPEPPAPVGDALELPAPYPAGTRGVISLGVTQESIGAAASPSLFYLGAQFFTDAQGTRYARKGVARDPLEGLDDCGVYEALAPASAPDVPTFFHVQSGQLLDGTQTLPLVATVANNESFSSYESDLAGRAPRFGGEYGFSARAPQLGGTLTIPLRLPEQLTVSALNGLERLPRADWSLRWSGRGAAPLRLSMTVQPEAGPPAQLECLLRDDGELTIPAAVLAHLPNGTADLTLTRELRSIEGSRGHMLLALGTVRVRHGFQFGEP